MDFKPTEPIGRLRYVNISVFNRPELDWKLQLCSACTDPVSRKFIFVVVMFCLRRQKFPHDLDPLVPCGLTLLQAADLGVSASNNARQKKTAAIGSRICVLRRGLCAMNPNSMNR